ncbi:MAG: acyl-CoA dehydrogenase family protein [Aliidongia sp.]
MDFTLSDEQRMMVESVRDLLAAECTVPHLRKLLEAGKTRDDARWAKLFELGLGGVLADEEEGGLGLRVMDFALVAEECGRALLPEPLIEHAGIAVRLLMGAQSIAPSSTSSPGLSRGSTSGSRLWPHKTVSRPDVDGRDKPTAVRHAACYAAFLSLWVAVGLLIARRSWKVNSICPVAGLGGCGLLRSVGICLRISLAKASGLSTSLLAC